MAVIAFPMGIFGKRLLLAGKGALKKKTLNRALRGRLESFVVDARSSDLQFAQWSLADHVFDITSIVFWGGSLLQL